MKKRNKILCGFLVLSLIIGTAVPSRATIKDEKDKLNNLQNEQEDVQQQINGLEKSKADAKTFINTVDSQVSAISKQMYDNENELDKTEKKIKKNEKNDSNRSLLCAFLGTQAQEYYELTSAADSSLLPSLARVIYNGTTAAG